MAPDHGRNLIRKSAFIMLFAFTTNTALAEEVAVQQQSQHSPNVTAIVRPHPLEPQQASPVCDDQTCGFRLPEDSWKRGILPPGFKASGANDFKVENADSVILERERAADTERLYEAAPLKLDFKFLGKNCELGSFTVGSSQEGGTRCLF
jgi:hypothetical protein